MVKVYFLALLRNHIFDTTIDISTSGVLKVTAITGVSRPISSSDIGPIALAALGMCVMAILFYLLVSKVILAAPTQSNKSSASGKVFSGQLPLQR